MSREEKSLKTVKKPNKPVEKMKEHPVQKYLRENPPVEAEKKPKPPMWEDLESMYLELGISLKGITDQIVKQIEYIKNGSSMDMKTVKVVQMFENDLRVLVDDLNDFRSKHSNGTEFRRGLVFEDDLPTYFLLGQEYKEISLRTIQLFQPIMIELTDVSLKVKAEINARDPNTITDAHVKNEMSSAESIQTSDSTSIQNS